MFRRLVVEEAWEAASRFCSVDDGLDSSTFSPNRTDFSRFAGCVKLVPSTVSILAMNGKWATTQCPLHPLAAPFGLVTQLDYQRMYRIEIIGCVEVESKRAKAALGVFF
jgi:hypothetical protein